MSVQDEIRTTLPKGCLLGQEIHYHEEIDSTNSLAKELAAQGAVHGTAVIADRQTAGRGRLGKSFHSPQGGMYLSVILRPNLPLSDMMAVTACTACAVFSALLEFGITSDIKWVNDLFLHGRKICGILCEGGFDPQTGEMAYLVIGIGLNLRNDPDLPSELSQIVTDIQSETGLLISRNALTASILKHLERFMSEIRERTFLQIYTEHSYTLGKRVLVMHGEAEREGVAVGYAEDAGLIVQFPDGTESVIRTGTARFADES